MIEDSLLPFSFPAVGRKKITAAFDGGRITSDSGVMLLGQAERRLGVADKLAAVIADPRSRLLTKLGASSPPCLPERIWKDATAPSLYFPC